MYIIFLSVDVFLQVSYVKGMDIYMFGCVGFIFASIVELACVGYFEKRMQRMQVKSQYNWQFFLIKLK